MDGSQASHRPDRHPSESYEDILCRDTRPVPDHLRQGPTPDVGIEPVPASRYYSADYFQKEVDHVWSKIWQMACREEEIPNPGDYHIYEIVGKSFIVTRTASGEIKAFYNTCLHRGRKLVTLNGCKEEFRCPYHGIAWNNDGSFKDNPIGWDFPQWEGKDLSLPQAQVGTWGGFVFINMDPHAKPLMDTIGTLAAHFERYDYPNRYKAIHVAKVVRCNWKVLAEAFMESHHAITTHPQLLPFLGDATASTTSSTISSVGSSPPPGFPARSSTTRITRRPKSSRPWAADKPAGVGAGSTTARAKCPRASPRGRSPPNSCVPRSMPRTATIIRPVPTLNWATPCCIMSGPT